MKRILLILSFSIALISCSKDIATDEQIKEQLIETSIQIENCTSAVDLYSVRVDYYKDGICTGTGLFGDVMIGLKSNVVYVDCDYVYVYFKIENQGVWGNIKVSDPYTVGKNTVIKIRDNTRSQMF